MLNPNEDAWWRESDSATPSTPTDYVHAGRQIVREVQFLSGYTDPVYSHIGYSTPEPIWATLYFWDDGTVTWTEERK